MVTPDEKYSVAYRAAYEAVYRGIVEAALRELTSDSEGISVLSSLENGWFDNVTEAAQLEAALSAEYAASKARDEAEEGGAA